MSPLLVVLETIVEHRVTGDREALQDHPAYRPLGGWDFYREELAERNVPLALAIVKALSTAGIILPDHDADAVADVLRGAPEGE